MCVCVCVCVFVCVCVCVCVCMREGEKEREQANCKEITRLLLMIAVESGTIDDLRFPYMAYI